MKFFASFLLIVTSVVLFNFRFSRIADPKPAVVIELFTSQGCSSCPAADRLLNELLKKNGNEIIGLSFHVTYWNNLGWKDPYSKEEYTQRQRNYSETMHLNSMYTPQMIVNGTNEFVGSDRRAMQAAITLATETNAKLGIAVSMITRKGNSINIAYSVDGTPGKEILYLAVVKKHVENQVPRGENHGMLLTHENVVVALSSVQLVARGNASIAIPETLDLSDGQVVLFIQKPGTLKIVGATQHPIP